jgi:hypothetical protein
LDLQERAVEQLRARTATLLAASSLTVSFFGAQAIRRTGGLDLFGVLALLAFIASIGFCVCVLLPRSGFAFCVRASEMHRDLSKVDGDDDVRQRWIHWLEECWDGNQDKIDLLERYYVIAAAALLIELILWSAALGTVLS